MNIKVNWPLIIVVSVMILVVIGLRGWHSNADYISKAHLFVGTYLSPISWCGNDSVTTDGAGDHIVTGCAYNDHGAWGKRATYNYTVVEDNNMNINKDLSSLREN